MIGKRQRITTKVGDVFKTADTAKGVRYLQLVALDLIELNSDVVVVFGLVADEQDLPAIGRAAYDWEAAQNRIRRGPWNKNWH